MRFLFLLFMVFSVQAAPWQIVLNADLTTGAKQGGQAILAGAQMAVDDINASGGLLGQPVELVIRDHRANPARGIYHVEQAAESERVIAILGGVHTPVILAELETIHQKNLIYLVPWAAGSTITTNGFEPNNVFRLSLRDEWVGEFLVNNYIQHECEHSHYLLERTGWGRSNAAALAKASDSIDYAHEAPFWFNWQTDLMPELLSGMVDHGEGDCVVFVGNTPDAVNMINATAALELPVKILSHWGIVADDFVNAVGLGTALSVDLRYVNTLSALTPKTEAGELFLQRYRNAVGEPNNSFNGAAHAFDLVHLLALAVKQADSAQADAIRQALYQLPQYDGVMRRYNNPFSVDDHEALTADDLLLLRLNADGVGE